MPPHEFVNLSRDCPVIRIPSGEKETLPASMQVQIMQSLGGTYTVMTNNGYLVRIDGRDADAIGKQVTQVPEAAANISGPADVEALVWEQLKTVYDPEIPVNIVELGLVYHCQVTPLDDGKYRVDVKFTLTAVGCGMGDILNTEIESRVAGLPGVKDVRVEVVFDPPWHQSMMSEAAQLELGMT